MCDLILQTFSKNREEGSLVELNKLDQLLSTEYSPEEKGGVGQLYFTL